MKKILIIIDMQYEFDASAEILPEVIKQIKRAIRRKQPIILVEYKYCETPILSNSLYPAADQTHEEIIDLLDDYWENVLYVSKKQDNGSEEIFNAITKEKLDFDVLEVCGVNSDCCVADTVGGLSERFPEQKIELIKQACATDSGRPRKFDDEFFAFSSQLKNVRVRKPRKKKAKTFV